VHTYPPLQRPDLSIVLWLFDSATTAFSSLRMINKQTSRVSFRTLDSFAIAGASRTRGLLVMRDRSSYRALSFYKRTPLTDCSLLASMGFSSIVHTVVLMADSLLWPRPGADGRFMRRATCHSEGYVYAGTSADFGVRGRHIRSMQKSCANNDRSAVFAR
jgi:hypothetical protein